MSINKAILIGNVGKDPVVRRTEGGAAVANFSIATTEKYKDKSGNVQEQTEWHNIVCWNGTAEIVEKYVGKGSQIYVEGKIKNREWKDQEGKDHSRTEILAIVIKLLGKRSENSQASPPEQSDNRAAPIFPEKPEASFETAEDDLPL